MKREMLRPVCGDIASRESLIWESRAGRDRQDSTTIIHDQACNNFLNGKRINANKLTLAIYNHASLRTSLHRRSCPATKRELPTNGLGCRPNKGRI
jgi:hypothetical protein